MANQELNSEALKRLNEAMTRSRKIMEMDGKMNQIASSNRSTIDTSINSPEPLLESSPAMNIQATRAPQARKAVNQNSKLPREILESFRNNKIEEAPVIDDSMFETAKRQISEEYAAPSQPKVQESYPSQGVIDYSMIRMIVDESVRKHISALSKKMLQESAQAPKLDAMFATGTGFKFLAKNGDLYEAKLIKKGNVHNKEA